MSFSQLFDCHCHGTTSILSSYRSFVLVEKRELSNHGLLSRHKAARLYFPFCSTFFCQQLWAWREMCLSLFVENFREYCQVTSCVETSSKFVRLTEFLSFLPSSGHIPHVVQKGPEHGNEKSQAAFTGIKLNANAQKRLMLNCCCTLMQICK